MLIVIATLASGSDKGVDEVSISFDQQGGELLISAIERTMKRGRKDHDHLMTPSWAGTELNEMPVGAPAVLVNHVLLDFLPAGLADLALQGSE